MEKTMQNERLPAEFLLASLITSYPDVQFEECVRTVLAEPGLRVPETLRSALLLALESPGRVDDLRSEFIDLFERGRSENPLYETEYGRDRALGKGQELADLSGFYTAFGLSFGGEGTSRDMRDHVSVELEFYSYLLLKEAALAEAGDSEGVAIVADARRKFLADHLGRFGGAIVERPGVSASPFYSQVFAWCRELVTEECRYFQLDFTTAVGLSGHQEPETVTCGTTGCGSS